MTDALQWIDDDHFSIGTTTFHIGENLEVGLEPGCFRVLKDRRLLSQYVDIATRLEPKRVIELGIFQGGSVALLALLSPIEHLLAVDLRPRCRPLDDWIEETDRGAQIHPHYNIDQSDSAKLKEIAAATFGAQQVDLIVDDASHELQATRASFNAMFPLLRTGGVFLIEDWAWDHRMEWAMYKAEGGAALAESIQTQTPAAPISMSLLILEIVLTAAHCAIIDDIRIGPNWVEIVRGSEPLPADFDIRTYRIGRSTHMLPG